MPYRLITEQMLQEHEVLARLSDALRTTIQWGQHGDLRRKLSAAAFLTESFQRHLEKMLALEENKGYMAVVGSSSPQIASQVAVFKAEHGQYREARRQLLIDLARDTEPLHGEVEPIFQRVLSLLEQVDVHNKNELNLLQELLLQQSASDHQAGPGS